MEIKCSPGYEVEKPNEKYKCDKVKIKGKKARVVKPEPKCIRKYNYLYTRSPFLAFSKRRLPYNMVHISSAIAAKKPTTPEYKPTTADFFLI